MDSRYSKPSANSSSQDTTAEYENTFYKNIVIETVGGVFIS